ncbi:MAG: transcription initiation protein [Gallionellaceae bacterium]|nr:MAG: transcription initiation protein [Gallionellaceae bacterium]
MQYLLIICHDDAFAPNEVLFEEIGTWIAEMEQCGIRLYGNPLRPADSAKTVRVRKGKVRVTNGAFADTEEKMCAYDLIECADMDEAVEAASKHPMAKVATIEVRPVWANIHN